MPTIAVLTNICDRRPDRPPGIERLQERAEVVYTDAAALPGTVKIADALLVWDFFSVPQVEVWREAARLAWIHIAAAGVDALLCEELVNSDVVLTNSRGAFDQPIAEYVLACVLAHAKGLHTTYRLQDQREWRHRVTRSIAGDEAMIVGTGSIGRAIARALRSAGMQVRGAARVPREGDAVFSEVVASASLADHVGNTDFLVVATPLTSATKGIVGERVLSALKRSAYLVNVARGPCVDTTALQKTLEANKIAGAALDVFETEPLPDHHPFWCDDRVLVSPHMAGDVDGIRAVLAQQFLDNAQRWLAGEPLHDIVDKRLGFAVSRGCRGTGS